MSNEHIRKMEDIMKDFEFCGYAKFVKWDIMSNAFKMIIDRNELDRNVIKEHCVEYVNDVIKPLLTQYNTQ